jgi:hypothetical protein
LITGLLTPFDSFSLLTLPGDAGTWSVTVFISSRDQALKELCHPEKWSALVAACPLHAQLLDGEPVTGILAMSGIVDRHRRLISGGAPAATGVLTVGDPVSLALEHDKMTQTRITPWYENTVSLDRARRAQIDASIARQAVPEPLQPPSLFQQAFGAAMLYDADIFRAMMEIVSMQALPKDVFARPGLADRVQVAARDHDAVTVPGPSRDDVLRMIA